MLFPCRLEQESFVEEMSVVDSSVFSYGCIAGTAGRGEMRISPLPHDFQQNEDNHAAEEQPKTLFDEV